MKTKTGEQLRMREPVREQGEMRYVILEDEIGPEHPARLFWQVAGELALEKFVERARAVQGRQGRDLISVQMLLTLWLYAVSQGIGSAREIERKMAQETAFRWISGGVKVGRTKLAAFRVEHREALDQMLTEVLAMLMHKKLLSLALVAQDGTKVRASAAATSFHRMESLQQCREQAALHVQAVLAHNDSSEDSAQVKKAREAAARDYERRVNEALGELKELDEERAQRHRAELTPTRASTTDPEAHGMKMPDGGFRPAYNLQLATAGSELGGPRTIVGVRVTTVGSDAGSVAPLLDDIERRTGQLPKTLLADGNHADHASIREAERRGVEALIPVPKNAAKQGKRAADDPPIQQWKQRMGTEQAQQTYQARASLAELVNAQLKSRFGLAAVCVRGIYKVSCVALLATLSINILAHGSSLLA